VEVYNVSEPKRISIMIGPYRCPQNFCKIMDMICNKTNKYNYEIELIVVDNTDVDEDAKQIQEKVEQTTFFNKKRYHRNPNNPLLVVATNQAIDWADSDFFVYLCSRHTFIYHPDWLKEMVEFFYDTHKLNGRYVMGGGLSRFPQGLGDPSFDTHVQGGLFISLTQFLKTHKYPDQPNHVFMDTNYCRLLFMHGYALVDIPCVKAYPNVGLSRHEHESYLRTFSKKISHSYNNEEYILKG
jgi:glycosyltransferase involved in cell wall biosynthesis